MMIPSPDENILTREIETEDYQLRTIISLSISSKSSSGNLNNLSACSPSRFVIHLHMHMRFPPCLSLTISQEKL